MPEVYGLLEALEYPHMARLSIGFLDAGLMHGTPEMVEDRDCYHVHLYGPGVEGLTEVGYTQVIVSFVPGTGISLKAWQKPW